MQPLEVSAAYASVESEALAAMGVDPTDLVAAEPELAAQAVADPTPGSGANQADKPGGPLDKWRKRHQMKVALRQNTLHGEATVQTRKGPVTVLVQRGTVTEITSTSITVKSTDGFSQTWKFSDKLRVIEKRAKVEPSALKAGDVVALAGPQESGVPTARLIVVPMAKA